MKIPAATSAVDKEWDKLNHLMARGASKVRSSNVIMDLCRLKHPELAELLPCIDDHTLKKDEFELVGELAFVAHGSF